MKLIAAHVVDSSGGSALHNVSRLLPEPWHRTRRPTNLVMFFQCNSSVIIACSSIMNVRAAINYVSVDFYLEWLAIREGRGQAE